MKYKVGDKVLVKSQEWYDENKDVFGRVKLPVESFIKDMRLFLGKVMTIKSLKEERYSLEEDHDNWSWTDDMFEGFADITKKKD